MTQATMGKPEEPPCIWALAGVLSHRPCDRHYDCEGCPLFHALSEGPGAGELEALQPPRTPGELAVAHQVNNCLARLLAGCTLHLDRAHSAGHWWVEAERTSTATLGIEPYVLRVLQPVDDVVMPRNGTWLRRPDVSGWIQRGRVSVPLHVPISGEVLEVNPHYLAAVNAPATFGDGDEWLLRLTLHEDPEAVPDLYRGTEALAWHLKTIQSLNGLLRDALAEQADGVGATLADGGEPVVDLEAVLGRARFDALMDRMFRIHSS